jgi:hypothetical protein
MKHIFISYSRKNQTYARQLATTLQNNGFDVWIDDRIDYGDRWWRTIVGAIEECGAFVVVMSPDSEQSEWVEREILIAQREHKPIFPLLLGGKVFSLLITTQSVNVTDGAMPPDDFYQGLARLIPPADHQGALVAPQPTATGEVQQTRSKFPMPFVWAGVSALIVIVIAVVIFMLNRGDNDDLLASATDQSTATQQIIAQDSTEQPTLTPTEEAPPSITPSPTTIPTELPIPLIIGTLDAQATIEQATANAEATISQWATNYAQMTQESINQTATATQWTNTPTPDITASIEAFRTEQAATVTQAWIDSWTATPTPTNTPTPNATATLIAFRPQTNADWTPIGREFDGVPMVLVPAGCFMMGSDSGRNDEKLVHEQCFDEPFWIDQYEVTQAQFVRLGGVKAENNRFSGDNRPIERITWFEARDFCELRGGRLPTEAEWEYAARGVDGLVYPWGNEWNANNAVYNRSSEQGTADVGSIPAGKSWIGAYDMSGNVWEWTSSLYESYPYDGSDGRERDTGNSTDVRRVLRGGSWVNDYSFNLRAPYRFMLDPYNWVVDLGGRCVLPVG